MYVLQYVILGHLKIDLFCLLGTLYDILCGYKKTRIIIHRASGGLCQLNINLSYLGAEKTLMLFDFGGQAQRSRTALIESRHVSVLKPRIKANIDTALL